MMSNVSLNISEVSKSFRQYDGPDVPVLNNISLTLETGNIAVLLGPNGCGKTTLLHTIAGLIDIDSGKITFGGSSVEKMTDRADVAVLFQDYENALLLWRTTRGNLTFPFEIARAEKDVADARIKQVADLLELKDVLNDKVHRLSGGYKQRVALAQALVQPADIVLLDEPWSSLDNWSRLRTQAKVRTFLQNEGKTALLVSHDLEEAIFIADVVILLTSRPASVATTVEVKHDGSRDETFVTSSAFLQARTKAVNAGKEIVL